MGRLLRKKDPTKKKTRVKPDDASVAKQDAAAPASTDAIKKPTLEVKKAPQPAAKPVVARQESRFPDKAVQFLREVKIELKKVTWPTRKQTMGSTVVVIVLVVIIAIFLGLVDMGLSSLLRVVLHQ
jgi:preprotein translocase subunit SecE